MAEIQVPTSTVEIKPGMEFFFGNSRIAWRVLEYDQETATALIIAGDIIAEKKYHQSWEDITWENCSLRSWLNGKYLKDTFSEAEQEAILETENMNPDNRRYHTKGGNPTKDRVFLDR